MNSLWLKKRTLGVRCLQVGSEMKKTDYFRELCTNEENEDLQVGSETKKGDFSVSYVQVKKMKKHPNKKKTQS